MDDCATAPCVNGGTCYDGNQMFECQCAEGWTGETCSEEVASIYACAAQERDCDPHATCTHTGPGAHDCSCFLRYTGDGHSCAEQGLTHCLPDCTLQVSCPALPPLSGGSIAYSNGYIYPTTATYRCDNGAAPPSGDALLHCQADGSWSGTAPTQCFSFTVVSGTCRTASSGTCVRSGNYPSNYNHYESCTIHISGSGTVSSTHFRTESD